VSWRFDHGDHVRQWPFAGSAPAIPGFIAFRRGAPLLFSRFHDYGGHFPKMRVRAVDGGEDRS
jgi:hypothetical protein